MAARTALRPLLEPDVCLRILLAEDDEEMRRLTALLLRRDGHQVTECANGIQLVRELADYILSTGGTHFDLIISDIRMPGLSALEVLEGLEGMPGIPPVILVSAFGSPETHEQARRLGAIALLDKPFRSEQLLSIVRQVASPDH